MSCCALSKRPCSICRKWFLPDARQKGRQKTCSPACGKELHRRQCTKWNRRNSVYFKANYLSKKLEKTNTPPAQPKKPLSRKIATDLPNNRINLDLPRDVIQSDIGIRPLIIMEYFAEQIIARTGSGVGTAGFT
ncbi:MAG: hypothetical protein GY834_16955 [Bacteroidetes bacterium]|nr:hypothetical protein [Bacteroidota bacterium]